VPSRLLSVRVASSLNSNVTSLDVIKINLA